MPPAAIRRLIRTLGANARRRGLFGRSRMWLALFLAGRLFRFAKRAAKRGEAALRYSEALRPGETLEISHLEQRKR